jgi:hypothetical protein
MTRKDLPKSRAAMFVSNPSSEGIGPVKALNPKIEKIIQASECIFVAQIKQLLPRKDLPKPREVMPVSNPSSEGIGPVKALFPIIQKIIQTSECIFVAQIKQSRMTRKDLHK